MHGGWPCYVFVFLCCAIIIQCAGLPVRGSPVAGSLVTSHDALLEVYYLLHSYWPDALRAVRCGSKPATFSL